MSDDEFPSVDQSESLSPPVQYGIRMTSLQSPIGSPAISITPSRASVDTDTQSVRPSRASSMVSTRTKISINTLQEDARSIDLVIGSQSFRIARDGSRVTSSAIRQESLPPYSPARSSFSMRDAPTPSTLHEEGGERDLPRRPTSRRGSIASNSTETADQAPSHDWDTDVSVYDPNAQEVQVSPRQPALGSPRENTTPRNKTRTSTGLFSAPSVGSLTEDTSSEYKLSAATTPSSATSRRQGFWFVSVLANLLGGSASHTSGPTREARSHSATSTAHESLGVDEPFRGDRSIGTEDRDEMARYDVVQQRPIVPISDYDPLLRLLPSRTRLTTDGSENVGLLSIADIHLPDTEEEVRNHYIDMVRGIDRDYRKIINNKDRELASLRERLNEVDQVYRQELRARDFTIDDQKRRLEHLKEQSNNMMERARHEVEDLWESRWKDRDHHLMERMRRMETDGQKIIQTIIEERDRMWQSRGKQVLERVKEGQEPEPP